MRLVRRQGITTTWTSMAEGGREIWSGSGYIWKAENLPME